MEISSMPMKKQSKGTVDLKGSGLSKDGFSVKTDAAAITDSLALPDLSSSKGVVAVKIKIGKKKKKRKNAKQNGAKSSVDGCDPLHEHLALPDLSISKEINSMPKKKQSKGTVDLKGSGLSKDGFSAKTDASAITDSLALPDLSSSKGVVAVKKIKIQKKKKKRKNAKQNGAKSNVDGCDPLHEHLALPDLSISKEINSMPKNKQSKGTVDLKGSGLSKDGFSVKTDAAAITNSLALPDLSSFKGVVAVKKIKIQKKKKKRKNAKQNGAKCNVDGCDPLHEHLALPDLSISKGTIEVKSNKGGKRKREETGVIEVKTDQRGKRKSEETDHNVVKSNVNGCGIPENTSSSKTSTPVRNGSLEEKLVMQLNKTIIRNSKNKLLILDLNGLLVDCACYEPRCRQPEPDFRIGRKNGRRKVYKRPFCDEFLQFCFERFHVGVWSSRRKVNVNVIIKFLLGESASKLLFCWNQSQCTTTGYSTVEDRHKPLVLKELRKIWDKEYPDVPWVKGVFNESNTLLLDDSPYKALLNPMHTAIFPYSYQYRDTKDSCLGPGGRLRVYLEGLAMAENVQEYVASNPFDQQPVTETNPSWDYYSELIKSIKERRIRALIPSKKRKPTADKTKHDENPDNSH